MLKQFIPCVSFLAVRAVNRSVSTPTKNVLENDDMMRSKIAKNDASESAIGFFGVLTLTFLRICTLTSLPPTGANRIGGFDFYKRLDSCEYGKKEACSRTATGKESFESNETNLIAELATLKRPTPDGRTTS